MPSETLTNYPMVPVLEHVESETAQQSVVEHVSRPTKRYAKYPADCHGKDDTLYDKFYGFLTNGGRTRRPIRDLNHLGGAIWCESKEAEGIREKFHPVELALLLCGSAYMLYCNATHQIGMGLAVGVATLLSVYPVAKAFTYLSIFINCRTGSEDDR